MTGGAHAGAGGALPSGGASVMALLACVTVGTLLSFVRVDGRGAALLATTTALCAAQLVGHATLTTAGHQHAGSAFDHAGGAFDLDASMAAAHLGAAVVLGVAITAAEYLYVVCSSVLCWLRLFAMRAPRHAVLIVRRTVNDVVVPPVFTTGLGMRAPPRVIAAA